MLLACQSCEQSNDSGVGIGQRLARSVDILQPQHAEMGVVRGRPGGQDVLLGQFGRGVNVGGPGLRSGGAAWKRDCGITRGTLRIPDTGNELSMAAGLRVEDLGAALPSTLAVDGSRGSQDELVGHVC